MLEEIRLLTNLETSTEKLLQIVLAGQPELEEKLTDPQLRQLRQRITLWAKTRPFAAPAGDAWLHQGAPPYRRQRGRRIFSPAAIEIVHRHARGIPRLINLLCEHALISAFVEHSPTVSEKIVEEVARDFDLQDMDVESAPKAAPSSAVPFLMDHGLPQAVRSASVPMGEAAGEKKT